MPVKTKGGKSYRTVWERLNAAHGDGDAPTGITQIETEIVSTTPLLVVKATVWFSSGQRFTGLSEAKLDAPANTADGTNPIECAETSAVGRALAFAGYYGSDDGIAGAEEVQRAQTLRQQAAPRPAQAPGPSRPPQRNIADERELGAASIRQSPEPGAPVKHQVTEDQLRNLYADLRHHTVERFQELRAGRVPGLQFSDVPAGVVEATKVAPDAPPSEVKDAYQTLRRWLAAMEAAHGG